jgi:hypothetical protein
MPELRISDPTLLPDLAAYLRERHGAVVEQTSDETLLVQLVGSYSADGMRLALDLLLRAWESSQQARGADVTAEVAEP